MSSVTPALQCQAQMAHESFRYCYSTAPQWLAAAPGRVNLIGEHTDYNNGFVLPMAIDCHVILAAAPLPSDKGSSLWQVYSTNMEESKTIDLQDDSPAPVPKWIDYLRGVIVGYQRIGAEIPSLRVLVTSTVPLGGGLSSSAALEVATATLIEAVTGQKLSPRQKALLCQKAEHDHAGVPCGIMDQFTSTMAQKDQFLLLDCESMEVEPIPLPDHELSVLMINTNVKHELTGGEYAQRRNQCEQAASQLGVATLRQITPQQLRERQTELSPDLFRRAIHVVTEIERVCSASTAIKEKQWHQLGKLMAASHISLRDDYQVSCPELDLLVDLVNQTSTEGVIGARMTGGGFGGCIVSLVKTEAINSISQEVEIEYQKQTGIQPTAFTTRPVQGAQVLTAFSEPEK